MTDYTELVKALRCIDMMGSCPCDYSNLCKNFECITDQAAAAIEELDAEETRLLLLTSDLQDKLMDLQEQLNDADVAAEDDRRQIEKLAKRNAELRAELERWVSAAEGLQAEVNQFELDNEDYEHEHRRLKGEIEALQAEVKAKESSKQRWRRLAMDTADYVDVVRCGDCQWYDPLDKSRPFFCPVMDCVNGVMEDDYCSRGERRAKMEVQDGSKD